MIPHAKIVELPEEVGEGGDVTDFLVRLGKGREDLLKLMAEAKPAPPAPELEIQKYTRQPRTPDSLASQRIERIKNDNSIAEVIRKYIQLKPSGTTLVGLCPFHEDHIPSLTVYPGSGNFHCYGCGKHGDVITFVREMENLTFRQALDALDHFTSQNESKPR